MLLTSMRIAAKNLTLSYKVLAYVGVLVLIAAAVAFGIIAPISRDLMGDVGLWQRISDALGQLGSGNVGLDEVRGQFARFLAEHRTQMWSMFGLLSLTVVILKFFGCLVALPQAEVIACRMEKNYQPRFVGVCIATFARSVGYSCFYTLFTVPFDVGLTLACGCLWWALRGALGAFAIPLVLLLYLFVLSLRIALFAPWVPELVRGKGGLFAALKRCFVNLRTTLPKQLPVTFFLIFLAAVLLLSTALLSFGLSVLLLLPAYVILQGSSQLVVHFEHYELKYYQF